MRRVKSTGRWGKLIEDAVRFRLVGLEAGSVVGVLELPPVERQDGQLGLDVTTLGEHALSTVLRTAAGEEHDVDVARALVKLAEQLNIGTRYDAVGFETSVSGVPRGAELDAAARRRLERVVNTGLEQRRDTLIGRLFEADFEALTAKLRAPDGQAIAVSFDEDQADDIKEALRNTAQLVGDVHYDPLTSQATKVVLRSISRAHQLELALETDDFWTDVTVEQLREERGIEPVDDPDALGATDLTDEEADELLAALGT